MAHLAHMVEPALRETFNSVYLSFKELCNCREFSSSFSCNCKLINCSIFFDSFIGRFLLGRSCMIPRLRNFCIKRYKLCRLINVFSSSSLLIMVETEYLFSTRVATCLLGSKFNCGIMNKFEYSSLKNHGLHQPN